MVGIIGVIALLTVLGLSLVITRLATVALTMTGLSEQAARFQARSAFTGTGFTTSEAEAVVDHPTRRRIIMLLMIVRSAGLVTILISLILSFVGPGTDQAKLIRLSFLAGGVTALWLLAQNRWVDHWLRRWIGVALNRWTDLDARDYSGLLNLSGDYGVSEMQVNQEDWVVDQSLAELRLRDEGVVVLGIYRSDGSYVGVPQAETNIESGDRLILYGRAESLQDLGERRSGPSGESAHDEAVERQKDEEQEQDRQEQASKQRREQASE